MSNFTEEQIEGFRQSGIRLDRKGEFWHEGVKVTHQGLKQALLRWLDVSCDGRNILRLDEIRYAYVDVEDAHLLVLSVRWDMESAWLYMNDKSKEKLDVGTLKQDTNNQLYCKVHAGRLLARFTSPAYYTLLENLEEQEDSFFLRHEGQLHVILKGVNTGNGKFQ